MKATTDKPASEKAVSEQSKKAQADSKKQKPPDNWRETIESVVVAFVLAFLFRTFEAEAFVIPTGSMAPTLYGQHRDIKCAQCGTQFAAGVDTPPSIDSEVSEGAMSRNKRSKLAICPNANCRFPNDVLDREMFAGDRILVNKFPYEFHDPQRWDVVVFKFPESAKTNYIKRLVGLPGEELKISAGDVWVRPLVDGEGQGVFRIPRKSPEKQRQLQLLVHDNDAPAIELLKTGWPEAWMPVEPQATGWVADDKARAFRVDPVSPGDDHEDWIRYSNYVPTAADWARAEKGQAPVSPPRPQWITDFYAYNNRITVGDYDDWIRGNGVSRQDSALWVGDLTLSCTVEVLGSEGEAIFELVKGQRKHRCKIDLTTGRGQLIYTPDLPRNDDDWDDAGEAFETGMQKPGKYRFSFANVDDRLCIWVDDRLVKSLEFEENSKFPPQFNRTQSSEADKTPVGIAARAARLRVSHLKIERDIYYTPEPQTMQSDHDLYFTLHKYEDDEANDEFLMLGDNSPRSNDSRAWHQTHTVARHLLIGKAFFVYWPHAVPFMNDGRGFPVSKHYEARHPGETSGPPVSQFSAPFYPNVGRMHRIR